MSAGREEFRRMQQIANVANGRQSFIQKFLFVHRFEMINEPISGFERILSNQGHSFRLIIKLKCFFFNY